MLDGIVTGELDGTNEHNELLDRALAEYNADGVFAVDTYIALREEGIDPDIYLAQLEGSNGLNVYEGEDNG